MTQTTEQLSSLFRQLEADKGSTGLAEFVMETLDVALAGFKPKNVDDLFTQFRRLFTNVKSTQPRISLVIYFFYDLWEELEKEKHSIQSIEDFKEVVKRLTLRIQVQNEEDFMAIVRHGVEQIENGDSILIHSHSGTVRKIFSTAHHEGKKFKVIVAEQEMEKTLDTVSFLQDVGIEFTVVPEYMLSHITSDVTKAFFGATTLNFEQNFVCDAGTYSVLAEFHDAQIPTYMFLSSKKFSLWKSAAHHNAFRTDQKRIHTDENKSVSYDRIKFSHDRVPAKLFNYIVTEEGAFDPEEIQKLYTTRYHEREEMRKKYFSDDDTEDKGV
jgi:translation initiation factor 2B subunit (eIF-2B alpha/beta/delta family)